MIGLLAELLSHLLILGLSPRDALARVRETSVDAVVEDDAPRVLLIRGVASFLSVPRLRRALREVDDGERVVIDFSHAMLVDNTALEYVHAFGRRYARRHGDDRFEVVGLEAHRAVSDHPDALHAQDRREQEPRWTPRQRRIADEAQARGWSFAARRDWATQHLERFHFFRVHPVEFRSSVVRGAFDVEGTEVGVTLSDVTFDEAPLYGEVYHTTALELSLPEPIPALVLEREGLLDRALELAGFEDIDFKHFTTFSRRFVLKGPDEAAIRAFMTPALLEFFEREEVYRLESAGPELVVFETVLRRATPPEIERMLGFGERLARLLLGHPAVSPSSEGEGAHGEPPPAPEQPAR